MVDSKPVSGFSGKSYCEEVTSALPAAAVRSDRASLTPEIQVTTAPWDPSSDQLPARQREEENLNRRGHFRNPAAAAPALRPSSASTSSGITSRLIPSHQISTNTPQAVRRHVRNLSLPPTSRHVQDSAPVVGMDTSLTMSNWNVQDQSLSPSRCVAFP